MLVPCNELLCKAQDFAGHHETSIDWHSSYTFVASMVRGWGSGYYEDFRMEDDTIMVRLDLCLIEAHHDPCNSCDYIRNISLSMVASFSPVIPLMELLPREQRP